MIASSELKQQAVARPLGVAVPNGTLARKVTEFIRDTESTLLFAHSREKGTDEITPSP